MVITAEDIAARHYDPAPNDYDLAEDPRCLWGWGPPMKPDCHHTWGHACFRALGHRGRCWDGGDPPRQDEPCAQAQRPATWDAVGRTEANR